MKASLGFSSCLSILHLATKAFSCHKWQNLSEGENWHSLRRPSCAMYGVPSESFRQNVVVLPHCAIVCHIVPHGSSHNGRPPPNTKHPKIMTQIPGKNNWESLKKKQLAYTLELFILSKTPFFCKQTQGYKNHKPTLRESISVNPNIAWNIQNTENDWSKSKAA